jgi:hypothetical protein
MHPANGQSYQLLVIGFIPKSNRCEHIGTGDTSNTGTKEVNIFFYDGFAHTDTKGVSFKLPVRNGFPSHGKETSSLWRHIASYAQTKLTRDKNKLSPRHVARCFLLPTDEADSSAGVTNVAEPSDCGEFRNDEGQHSGKYYIKYEQFDGDEYIDENVYVIQ